MTTRASPGLIALGVCDWVTVAGLFVKFPPQPMLAPVVMSYTDEQRSVSIAALGGSCTSIWVSCRPSSAMPPVELAVNIAAHVVSLAPPANVVGSRRTSVGLLDAVNVTAEAGCTTAGSDEVDTPNADEGYEPAVGFTVWCTSSSSMSPGAMVNVVCACTVVPSGLTVAIVQQLPPLVRSRTATLALCVKVPAGAVNVIVPEWAASPPVALTSNWAVHTIPLAP